LMDTPSVVDIKRVVCLIEHRLSHSESRDYLTHGLLVLLSSIMERVLSTMSSGDTLALKEFIFIRPGIIKTSLLSETLSDLVREGRFLTFVTLTLLTDLQGTINSSKLPSTLKVKTIGC
jgi:hypothetical protein